MKPGDLFKFLHSNVICTVIDVYKQVYQIDSIETVIKYMSTDSTVFERSYMEFSGRLYVGMREIEILVGDKSN